MASFADSADTRRPQLDGDPVLDRCERLPHSVGMDTLLGEISVRYARGRFARVCSDLGGVAMRTTKGRVAIGGRHAASFQFRELQIAGYVSRGLFFEAMDAESQSTCNLAEALIEEWDEPADLCEAGPILELERFWSVPGQTRSGGLSVIVAALVDALFARHAVLILKAFPLEFEGNEEASASAAFERRLRAMKRHYARSLGVSPLRGTAGENGWMRGLDRAEPGFRGTPRGQVAAQTRSTATLGDLR